MLLLAYTDIIATIRKKMTKSYEKNLDKTIWASKLGKRVDNRWLIITKMSHKWKLVELSDYTGIPKSTIASRTKGFNGSNNLLNTIFRDYILPKPDSRLARRMLRWVSRNLSELGDDSCLNIPFFSKGQERYNSRLECHNEFNSLIDYLSLHRDPDSLMFNPIESLDDEDDEDYGQPFSLPFFTFFTQALCQIIMAQTLGMVELSLPTTLEPTAS